MYVGRGYCTTKKRCPNMDPKQDLDYDGLEGLLRGSYFVRRVLLCSSEATWFVRGYFARQKLLCSSDATLQDPSRKLADSHKIGSHDSAYRD